jgi:Reverse transcriptase (RNA-dependent DNA polymerase)
MYNNRLLAVVGKHIESIQTAYIKGQSTADNLRLLNSVTKLADCEEDINATIIALDAQKAFDSVSHKYIERILYRVGLSNFFPIFKLLYKDLKNDIMMNGRVGAG